MKRAVGQNHPYRWPKTTGFYTRGGYLKEDKIWYLTEKIAGCNLSISTEGWVASRNKIIGERGMGTLKFQGVSIEEDCLDTLFRNIHKLKDHFKLADFFENVEFELTLYGKLILKGTDSSDENMCNYRKKNINNGDFICFGIGFAFQVNVQLPPTFSNLISSKQDKGERNLIVPISYYLARVLKYFDIAHTDIHMIAKLSDILHDGKFNNVIIDKELEGYVLYKRYSEGEGLINQLIEVFEILKLKSNRVVKKAVPRICFCHKRY
jgi:hypothetical protein